ncbi:MAG: hypothetical protein O9267_13820 [Flavobacterium sp.]|uniref:hypothetical protein n=1 Tax=Flavobacterium sp. TaxID=239 RepID=UPI0022C36D9C|nr:hypothetical protein [Flavobacterium sp.]MCZ8198677.1 hypothetical protein [Flavobacterium sp.]
MKIQKLLNILILILIFSCSEKTKKSESKNLPAEKQKVSTQIKNTAKVIEISDQEKNFNEFIDSLKIFIVKPVDTLKIEVNPKQIENYKIAGNTIQIFKKDTFNIDWIKINNNKILIKSLKTINPRVDGEREKMFCNNVEKIKLYNFNKNKIIFLEFNSNPCTGLGCSVSDYIIYDLKNNQVNLFGNFRTANLNFYSFPFDKKLNYISTEYQGDFHGNTPIHFISRIYSMDNKGKFQLKKDLKGKEYYYEIITFPEEETGRFEYKRNWFCKEYYEK